MHGIEARGLGMEAGMAYEEQFIVPNPSLLLAQATEARLPVDTMAVPYVYPAELVGSAALAAQVLRAESFPFEDQHDEGLGVNTRAELGEGLLSSEDEVTVSLTEQSSEAVKEELLEEASADDLAVDSQNEKKESEDASVNQEAISGGSGGGSRSKCSCCGARTRRVDMCGSCEERSSSKPSMRRRDEHTERATSSADKQRLRGGERKAARELFLARAAFSRSSTSTAGSD